MIDQALLHTAAEKATEAAGSSLARSLHHVPVTIGLSGELGMGKTAFLRGFLRQLGIDTPVTSPTYALEQRYDTPLGDVLHIDLYRLNQEEAVRHVRESDGHTGIRCIEWPERAGNTLQSDIQVTITERGRDERDIQIVCNDVAWPDDATIDAWRAELHLPPNVGAHCDAVAEFCAKSADELIRRGIFARRGLVRAAGRTHDLLRFVNFHPGAGPAGQMDAVDDVAVWNTWKDRYGVATHEEAAELFLRERNFPELAHLVASHSVHVPVSTRTTTEEHLLYYADKRFVGDVPVSIVERFADFAERYGEGKRSAESLEWERESGETEHILFPDGYPF